MYGKRGINNPKYGKKYGLKPKISIATKASWKNDAKRKKLYSENMTGAKNNQAKRCVVDGINFDCLMDAALYFGYSIEGYNYSELRKNHNVEIKEK